jgi:hypothetical protein
MEAIEGIKLFRLVVLAETPILRMDLRNQMGMEMGQVTETLQIRW